MTIFFGLSVRVVLGEEYLGHLHEVMKRVWWQREELILDRTFQAERKGKTHDWVIARVDHHLVSEVSDVLNWITHFGVVVKSGSQKIFSRTHTPGSP